MTKVIREIEDGEEPRYLTRRSFHAFLNSKPVELPITFRQQFYESYGLHVVNDHTLPFVIVHVET